MSLTIGLKCTVAPFTIGLRTILQPIVKIDDVRVDVVEEAAIWHEAGRNSQATAERLNEASVPVWLPKGFEVRELPTLPASPLERGSNRIRRLRRVGGDQRQM